MKLEHFKTKTREYYEDSEGRLQGEYKWWYIIDGRLWEHCFYKNNHREGEYKLWYQNGGLWKHCFYKNGLLEGEFKRWYSDGQLFKHCFYINGKEITNEEWLKLKIKKILDYKK